MNSEQLTMKNEQLWRPHAGGSGLRPKTLPVFEKAGETFKLALSYLGREQPLRAAGKRRVQSAARTSRFKLALSYLGREQPLCAAGKRRV